MSPVARLGRGLERFVHALATLLAAVAAVALLLLLLASTFDVVSRHIRGQGLGGVVESGEILLVVLALAGLAAAQRSGAHVGIDLLSGRVPERVAAAIEAVATVVVVVVVAWLVWRSSEVAWAAFQSGEYRIGITRVPVWPARAAVTMGAAALLLELLVQLAHAALVVAGRPGSRPPRSVGTDATPAGPDLT